MRMTLNLPDELISDAMKGNGTATKTSIIVLALEDYVRRKKCEDLISLRGTIKFYDGFDPETLRDKEEAELGPH
ncbi:MAG: type II toxin-antitoxin system VapB family antitoxin [Rectinemataceae bacterium]